MEKVSIIIPVYNAEKYLNKCLDSVVNQTYQNIEIILVDDGSTDTSSKICEEYQNKHQNIEYKKTKNSGVSNARNTGLKMATGKYIFFLDSDDYLEENSIQELMSNKTSNSLIGLVPTGYEYQNSYSVYEYFRNIMINKCLGNVWGFLFEKDKIDFEFDIHTHLMEDTLFLLNYISKVELLTFINEIKYNYVININGITKSKNIEKIILNIKSFDYSLDQIKKIINEKYKDKVEETKKLIEHKKIKLLESELIKISGIEDLKIFVNDKNVINILNNNNSSNIILKIVKRILSKKNFILCLAYIKARKIYMKLKNK